jgi:hypothetical protein
MEKRRLSILKETVEGTIWGERGRRKSEMGLR